MKRILAVLLLLTLAAQAWGQDFEKGEAAFATGDYIKAYQEWKPLAAKGDARAQWGVAHLYLLGLGVEQNLALGAKWAKKSAEQGYVEALSLLAGMYERGVGVPKNLQKSIQLRKKAAETGDSLAQYNLALKYLEGKIVRKDVNAAVVLLNSAARQNFQGPMFNLGVLFFKGQAIPQDLVRSYMWFEVTSSWKPGPGGDRPIGSVAGIGERATGIKKMLIARMSPTQISEAQRLAREWMEAFEKRKKK